MGNVYKISESILIQSLDCTYLEVGCCTHMDHVVYTYNHINTYILSYIHKQITVYTTLLLCILEINNVGIDCRVLSLGLDSLVHTMPKKPTSVQTPALPESRVHSISLLSVPLQVMPWMALNNRVAVQFTMISSTLEKADTPPVNPSCLQATAVLWASHPAGHTLPHTPETKYSRVPEYSSGLSTRRKSPVT